MTHGLPSSAELLLCDSRGIYIPRDFATEVIRECVQNVDDEQWSILESGPEHEYYWDVWSEVEQVARITPRKSQTVYYLYQDGDLWMIPENATWPEEYV